MALSALIDSIGPRARAINFANCGANVTLVATPLSVLGEAPAKTDLTRDTQYFSLLLLKL